MCVYSRNGNVRSIHHSSKPSTHSVTAARTSIEMQAVVDITDSKPVSGPLTLNRCLEADISWNLAEDSRVGLSATTDFLCPVMGSRLGSDGSPANCLTDLR